MKHKPTLTHQGFRYRLGIAFSIALIALAATLWFCMAMLHQYELPSAENTYSFRCRITEIEYTSGHGTIRLVTAEGEKLEFVYPWRKSDFFEAIGYDWEELVDLLEGQEVTVCRMERQPWIISLTVGDITLDNLELTRAECQETHLGIGMIGLLLLAIVTVSLVEYWRSIWKLYQRGEKNRRRRERRAAAKRKEVPKKLTPAELTAIFSMETEKKFCLEIEFSLDNDSRYQCCWMGKLYDRRKKANVYWYGLAIDGSQAYDFPTFEEFCTAPVFHGQSLFDVLDRITILSCMPPEMEF